MAASSLEILAASHVLCFSGCQCHFQRERWHATKVSVVLRHECAPIFHVEECFDVGRAECAEHRRKLFVWSAERWSGHLLGAFVVDLDRVFSLCLWSLPCGISVLGHGASPIHGARVFRVDTLPPGAEWSKNCREKRKRITKRSTRASGLAGGRGIGYLAGGFAGIELLKAGALDTSRWAYGTKYGSLILFTGIGAAVGSSVLLRNIEGGRIARCC